MCRIWRSFWDILDMIFINETKMGTKRHQDEVKSWVLMHQDEALVETIETDIWIA